MSLLPKHCRVLVIDDNVDAAEFMSTLLHMEGFTVQAAVNGVDGLAKAFDLIPQVICVDIELRDVCSSDLVKTVRAHPSLSNVLIVGMTGWDERDAPDLEVRKIFDCVFVKPVPIEALSNKIRRFCYQ